MLAPSVCIKCALEQILESSTEHILIMGNGKHTEAKKLNVDRKGLIALVTAFSLL